MGQDASGVPGRGRVPAWVDNGPVYRMGDEMLIRVRQLGFKGCEVLQVRLDGFKAVVLVDGPGALQAEFQDGKFAGVQMGAVRVLWRLPVNGGEQGEGLD